MGHTISVFPERESLGWLVPELLLIEILSGNVGAFPENVAGLGPAGWKEWLAVEDCSGVEEELVDLAV